MTRRSVLWPAPVPPEVRQQSHGRAQMVRGLHSVLAGVVVQEVQLRHLRPGSVSTISRQAITRLIAMSRCSLSAVRNAVRFAPKPVFSTRK